MPGQPACHAARATSASPAPTLTSTPRRAKAIQPGARGPLVGVLDRCDDGADAACEDEVGAGRTARADVIAGFERGVERGAGRPFACPVEGDRFGVGTAARRGDAFGRQFAVGADDQAADIGIGRGGATCGGAQPRRLRHPSGVTRCRKLLAISLNCSCRCRCPLFARLLIRDLVGLDLRIGAVGGPAIDIGDGDRRRGVHLGVEEEDDDDDHGEAAKRARRRSPVRGFGGASRAQVAQRRLGTVHRWKEAHDRDVGGRAPRGKWGRPAGERPAGSLLQLEAQGDDEAGGDRPAILGRRPVAPVAQ